MNKTWILHVWHFHKWLYVRILSHNIYRYTWNLFSRFCGTASNKILTRLVNCEMMWTKILENMHIVICDLKINILILPKYQWLCQSFVQELNVWANIPLGRFGTILVTYKQKRKHYNDISIGCIFKVFPDKGIK